MTRVLSGLHVAIFALTLLTSCSNNPYRPGESNEHTFFSSFSTAPDKLDPATSYWMHEAAIIDQIYEPPLQYHYLKRPYQMVPLTAKEVPVPIYYDKSGQLLSSATTPPNEAIGRVEYTVRIKQGIKYHDHPCFARDEKGQLIYQNVTASEISKYESVYDFTHKATRELEAKDYVLQIRRLADPRLASPVYSAIKDYMAGMEELQELYSRMLDDLRAERKKAGGIKYNQEKDERDNPIALDYMAPPFEGAQVIDTYNYKIVLERNYPQILYWMCMHFFAAMPQEALDFYNQPAMTEKQFTVNRCPIGTGPYYIERFRPNEVIIMERNQNYHEDYYPSEGDPGDEEAGLLVDAGKPIPFIDRQVYRIEKAAIPRWRKFLQGYYDTSGIESDVFDQAISMKGKDDARLSDSMAEQGIVLLTGIRPILYYTQFNMLDDVVGGLEPEKSKLRQAISIAMDYNEYLDIFENGRGLIGQGPIPPGIFGHTGGEEGTNPFVNEWEPDRGRHVNKPVEIARKLMIEAGYPNGIGPDGTPLTLYYDHASSGSPTFRSSFEWMRHRIGLLGIRLEERGTDLSRYRAKRKQGHWQISMNGWVADYPDPENFLFLFYGPNGIVEYGGPNSTNYDSPEYNALFRKMETMQNSPERQKIIDQMTRLLQQHAPAIWNYYPVSYILHHAWYKNVKPHDMSSNVIKYKKLDPAMRTIKQEQWNHPIMWPVYFAAILVIIALIPAAIQVYRRERGI